MDKKRVLVLGSTGAMGQYLVPKLADRGYLVDAVSLDEETPCSENVRCIRANAKDEAYLAELVTKGQYDGIVDFMIWANYEFPRLYKLFLENTGHYIFLSTYRVYAGESPITEESPRLLDVSEDAELVASNDYCIHKARGEDILTASDYENYTIIRPAITYSKMRYQLVTLEAPLTVGRALAGKTVLLPEEVKNVQATMTWASDVADMIEGLLFNPRAMKETFTVSTAETHTWGEIASFYEQLVGMKIKWVNKEIYIKALGGSVGVRWQLDYDRLFERVVDNSKVLRVTGLRQSDFMPLFEGLKYEISRMPKDAVLKEYGCMDQVLEELSLVE